MQNSTQFVNQACAGYRPERTPIFDLLLNDPIIEYFAGEPLDGIDDEATIIAALRNGFDGSRYIGVPDIEGRTWIDELGNLRIASRWTNWIRQHALNNIEEWTAWIKTDIERLDAQPLPTVTEVSGVLAEQKHLCERLGGTMYVHCTPSTAINEMLFGKMLGLQMFSYLWADERDLILCWMKAIEVSQRRYIERTAHAETSPLAIIYSDVAFKLHPMFSRRTFNEFGFFDDVAAICDACHRKGLQVIFHSDGDITTLIDDLVAAGIDGLNPLEKAAGIDVYALRRQYPQLIFVGGVDVTHLLREGAPDDIRKEARRMIREIGSEGRLLIGSSTEVSEHVPLINYLAFHDEVMQG